MLQWSEVNANIFYSMRLKMNKKEWIVAIFGLLALVVFYYSAKIYLKKFPKNTSAIVFGVFLSLVVSSSIDWKFHTVILVGLIEILSDSDDERLYSFGAGLLLSLLFTLGNIPC